MNGLMKWTRRQVEWMADFLKSASLVVLSGSVADAFVDGTRLGVDFLGMAIGVGCLAAGFWLTGKLDGDRMGP